MVKKVGLGLLLGILALGIGWSGWWTLHRLGLIPTTPPTISLTDPFGSVLYPQLNTASDTTADDTILVTSPPTSPTTAGEPVAYKVEEFVRGLEVPWSIVFTSPDRMLVTERAGRLRVIQNGRLLEPPLATFEVSSRSEDGLLGLTLHPQYDQNKWLYVAYSYQKGSEVMDRVVRFKDNEDSLSEETIILDNIPAANVHAGSRLHFGPDQKLYITAGDATERQLAQDQNSLAGKILRLNDDGSIPNDNPIAGSPVWSWGHRNPQGMAWHPVTGTMYETEHGPSGFDGPGGGDEVNVIGKGQNYGWPLVSHTNNRPGLVAPKIVFTPAVAPASGLFYSSTYLPQFENNFFFGALRGEALYRVIVSDNDSTEVVSYEKIPEVTFGRIREVAQGPDGMLYFTTSNRDGRGRAREGDDKIYRLVRAE